MRTLSDAMPDLSVSPRKIVAYILGHVFEVATDGIEDLATAVGISTASVSRFVICLNYSSFSSFKQALLQVFKLPFCLKD